MNYMKRVLNFKQNVPPNVKQALDKIGNEPILSARCGRTPVQAIVQGALRAIANVRSKISSKEISEPMPSEKSKDFSDGVPYDNLFHLFIELTLPSGKWVIEKIERINLVKEDRTNKTGAEFTSSFPVNKTVNELFQNTQNFMGARFLPYQSNSNNCQVFIMGILDANGLNNSELTDFVKQDTRSIFKNNPALRKFANTLTDLGGYASAVIQGGDLINQFSNELTNYEINDLMKHYKLPFHGCYVKDKLPTRLSNGAYIINLNGTSHWTALIKDGDIFYYFDSFGFPAVNELETRGYDIIWSDVDIQSMLSSSCGWFCIAWIRFMKNKKDKKKAYADFLKLFSSRTTKLMENEKILGGLLR